MNRILSIAAAITIAFCTSACTDANGATEVLQDQGYSNIEITGYAWLGGCSEDDEYKTTFTATSPGGYRVRGVVCAGLLFKGTTVRIFGRVGG